MLFEPCRSIALAFEGAVVLAPSYRLAAEHAWPAAVSDTRCALEWLADHAAELKVDPSKGFIVGGFSAGAMLAAVAASEAHFNKLRYDITGTLLGLPWLMNCDSVPERYRSLWKSRDDAACGEPGMTAKDLLDALDADPRSPLFSPLNHPRGLAGLPRTWIQAVGRDLFRDDAVVYHHALADGGVDAHLEVFDYFCRPWHARGQNPSRPAAHGRHPLAPGPRPRSLSCPVHASSITSFLTLIIHPVAHLPLYFGQI